MYQLAKFSMLLAALSLLTASTSVEAADQIKNTTIVVKGMRCKSCANKIIAALQKVPGVARANADAKRGLAAAASTNVQQLPSPRAQWEAIEKAGFTPVALHGPFGTFQEKPTQ